MQPEPRVGAVILAAGASSRFGSPKPLARVGTGTMLDAVIELAAAAGLDPVLAVVRSGTPVAAPATPVANDQPELGMSRSLQLGIAAVPDGVDAAIVLLGDQPTVDRHLLERIVAARGASPVVATRASGVVSPPVLMERAAFPLVHRLRGDVGLRDLLRTDRRPVTLIDVEAPVSDVDVPADLDALTEPCPGCGARFLPYASTETHAYIGASPACWAAFGELLAREFGDPAYGWIHRHTVDVYTVQHPGQDDRRQRQSVALHLIGLCHWLEHDLDMRRLNPLTQRLANDERAWPWLDPPRTYPITVLDVLAARDGDEHGRLVRRWAEATWHAWSAHHARIRRWARKALD